MPTSRDLAIFVPTTTTTPVQTDKQIVPCACARGNDRAASESLRFRFVAAALTRRIKRKTSRNVQSRKLSWWFVVHADEPVLRELDEKWESLSTQTSWILKPCSKPADTEHHGSHSSIGLLNENSTLDTQRISDITSNSALEHLPAVDGELSNEPTVKEKPDHQVNPESENE